MVERALAFVLVLAASCTPLEPLEPRPPEADPTVVAMEALRGELVAELAEVEADLARAPSEALLDRRLLLTVALAEVDRRLARGAQPLERAAVLRLAERQIVAARHLSASSVRSQPPDELALEGDEEGRLGAHGLVGEDAPAPPEKATGKSGTSLAGDGTTREAAVVQDAGTEVPLAVQRALAEQMGRTAPCLPPSEQWQITVRAQWFGEHLRGVALVADPPLVPAIQACLVEALEAMRLPSSEGTSRVLVFPIATR